MAALWPTTLPQNPLLASYSQAPAQTALRTPMSVGPDKVRPRSLVHYQRCQISLRMKRAQVQTFEAFWQDTLLQGALLFEWKHHQSGNVIEYRFLAGYEAIPLTPRTTPSVGDEWWTVSFELETVPGTEILPEETPEPVPPAMVIIPPAEDDPSLEAAGWWDESMPIFPGSAPAEPVLAVILEWDMDDAGPRDDREDVPGSVLVESGGAGGDAGTTLEGGGGGPVIA